ncbi:MAG: autotransporter-associated beta strand repeat-containing protein [Kiritimatiellia bacterium]
MKEILGIVMLAASCAAWAEGGSETLVDGVLTLDGLLKSIAAESELGAGVTNVVMTNGGGVDYQADGTAGLTYAIAGDGLAATGVISVASGVRWSVNGARLPAGAVGHTLVKRGAGVLSVGVVGKACAEPTRFIVEEGTFACAGGDFWGGHTTANNNCTIDVREGAVYDHGTGHGVVGPLELTGATFTSRNSSPYNNQWADASLNGGVTAHASAVPSRMSFVSWGFLGHNNQTNCVFDVEDGARLIVDGVLRDGYSNACANRLTKRGAGELVLLKDGGWTGGTFIEAGTLTVAASQALAAGAVVIAGDATLRINCGVTVDLANLATDGGAHTLTLTGGGAATLPATLPAGLTVEASTLEGMGSAVDGSKVHLNGNVALVDVAAGQTLVVTDFVDAGPGYADCTDVVKTGDGTLVLPTGSQAKFEKLIVQGGFVEIEDESCFGAEVALEDGGALRFTKSFDQARARIVCTGAVGLDVPAGVTFGIHPDYFVSTGATVTKTGGGVWRLAAPFRNENSSSVNFTGTTWVVDEGTLKLCSGDAFVGAGGTYPLVIEIHEEAVLEAWSGSSHVPLCGIVLRGGTLYAPRAQFGGDYRLESGATWKGFGLQGPVTALPSERPSRIIARQCHLAHGSGRTIFDVREGAVLEIDTMLSAGRGGSGLNHSGLVKRGRGTLKFLKPIGTKGVFSVEDGTVELGPRMRVNDALTLDVSGRAKFVLGDGSQLATTAEISSKLCSSADIWFDASRLDLADGATVSSVPNLGSAGGSFVNVTAFSNYTPAAPAFVKSGINGLGTVAFNGSQSLVTKAYTNRGERVTLFIVSKWTSWAATGGQGKWGGPISLSALSPVKTSSATGDDNQCYGSVSFQHASDSVVGKINTMGGDIFVYDLSVSGLAVGTPYLTRTSRSVAGLETSVWCGGDADPVLKSTAGTIGNCDIDTVCIGGRLRLGVPQIFGLDATSNRMYIGQIGEVLVFSRLLTDGETASIDAYLRNKWFGADELSAEARKGLAPTLDVAVAAGEAAAAVGTAESVAVAKTGGGTLRLGGAFAEGGWISVAEGALALRTGAMAPQVDIWVDASESAGMSFDADGRVTNLVNRGSCGGSFVRNARRAGTVPSGPIWSETETINGRPTLVFDGDSALALFAYTNTTAPRQLSVYCMAERTDWALSDANDGGGLGKWAGPFALGDTTATLSDERIPGAISVQEDSGTSAFIDLGGQSTGNHPTPATGEPYLLVLHTTTNGYLYAYEKVETPEANVPRKSSSAMNLEPLRIDIVQLATRTAAGGGPQWWGHGNAANRSWYGKIGEFIVTTEPLDEQQEYELFAYLRKKWMDKGEGTATPPAWLTGYPATPVLGPRTQLKMASGTSLEHAADTVKLDSLETAGTVNWTRVWDAAAGAAAFTLFDVADAVSLGDIMLDLRPVPRQAKIVGVPSTAAQAGRWTVSGGPGAGSASVSLRADGFWLSRAGMVLHIR